MVFGIARERVSRVASAAAAVLAASRDCGVGAGAGVDEAL